MSSGQEWLPIKLIPHIRSDFESVFEGESMQRAFPTVTGDVLYMITNHDFCPSWRERRDWEPLTLDDETRNHDHDMHFDKIVSYTRQEIVRKDSCHNLDVYSRLFSRFGTGGDEGDEGDDRSPHVVFRYCNEMVRDSLYNKRYPREATGYKGHLMMKEMGTNTVHYWNKDLHETVVCHPLIHPQGDMFCYDDKFLIQVIDKKKYDVSRDDEQDIMFFYTPPKNEIHTLLRNFNRRSENLDCLFWDFNCVMMSLTGSVVYTELQLREMKEHYCSFLTPEDIFQELLYIIDCKIIELRGHQALDLIAEAKNSEHWVYPYVTHNINKMLPLEWEEWLAAQRAEIQRRPRSTWVPVSEQVYHYSSDDNEEEGDNEEECKQRLQSRVDRKKVVKPEEEVEEETYVIRRIWLNENRFDEFHITFQSKKGLGVNPDQVNHDGNGSEYITLTFNNTTDTGGYARMRMKYFFDGREPEISDIPDNYYDHDWKRLVRV